MRERVVNGETTEKTKKGCEHPPPVARPFYSTIVTSLQLAPIHPKPTAVIRRPTSLGFEPSRQLPCVVPMERNLHIEYIR